MIDRVERKVRIDGRDCSTCSSKYLRSKGERPAPERRWPNRAGRHRRPRFVRRNRVYGQGSVYERNGIWYVGMGSGGRFIRRSSRSSSRADAVRLLKKLQAEAVAGTIGGRQRIRINELLDDLLADYRARGLASCKTVRIHMTRLRREVGSLRPSFCDRPCLNALVIRWRGEGLAPATVNKHLGTLHRAFMLGRENGKITTVPTFPHLPEHNARQSFVEPEEFYTFLKGVGDLDLRDFLEWLYCSAMRWGESAKLTWPMLNEATWELQIPSYATKNHESRVVPVEGVLRAILARRLARKSPDCPFIFNRRKKQIRAFTKSFRAACDKVGWISGRGGITPHDFRRSAARNMRRARVSESVIMKLGGWKTAAMFRRYAIIDTRDLTEALETYDAFLDPARRAQGSLARLAG